MNWRENTTDTKLEPGTQLLGLRKRGPFSRYTTARWHDTIDPLVVGRVGTICRDESRSDKDKIVWYGHNYQSAGSPESYSHYLLLTDLPELPALPVPTAEDIAQKELWDRQHAERTRAACEAMKQIYSDENLVAQGESK